MALDSGENWCMHRGKLDPKTLGSCSSFCPKQGSFHRDEAGSALKEATNNPDVGIIMVTILLTVVIIRFPTKEKIPPQ